MLKNRLCTIGIKAVKVCLLLLSVGSVLTGIPWSYFDSWVSLSDTKYFQYLAPKNIKERAVETAALDKGKIKNLITNNIYPANLDGLQITINRDGSITFDGVYSGKDRWLSFAPAEYPLEDGYYYFSDGGFSSRNPKCKVVFGGRKKEEERFHVDSLVNDLSSDYFYADGNTYFCYWYGLHLLNGYTADSETLHPLLYKIDRDQEKPDYSPCTISYYHTEDKLGEFALFYMPKEEFLKMPASQIKIFENNLKSVYLKKYKWCSIVFDDHTGLRFDAWKKSPEYSYGEMDALGQISSLYKSSSSSDMNSVADIRKELL